MCLPRARGTEQKDERRGGRRGEKEQQKAKGFAGTTRRKKGRPEGAGGQKENTEQDTEEWEGRRRDRGWERHPGSSAALNLFDPVGLARRSSRYIPVAGWAHGEKKRRRDGETEGSGSEVTSEESRKTKVCWWKLEGRRRGGGRATQEGKISTDTKGFIRITRRPLRWEGRWNKPPHTGNTHKRPRTGTHRSGILSPRLRRNSSVSGGSIGSWCQLTDRHTVNYSTYFSGLGTVDRPD